MSQTVKGNGGAVPQTTSYEWIAGQGWRTTVNWRGTKAAIIGLAGVVQKYDQGFIASGDGVVWEASAMAQRRLDGSQETPVNTWEMDGSAAQKDIRLSEYYSDLTDEERENVETKLANSSASVTLSGKALELYREILSGEDSILVPLYVLRNTQTMSRLLQATMSVANVLRVWSVQQITSLDGLFPVSLANAMAAIPVPTGLPATHIWGWLKQPPQLHKAFAQKTVITTEWILEACKASRYPLAA